MGKVFNSIELFRADGSRIRRPSTPVAFGQGAWFDLNRRLFVGSVDCGSGLALVEIERLDEFPLALREGGESVGILEWLAGLNLKMAQPTLRVRPGFFSLTDAVFERV